MKRRPRSFTSLLLAGFIVVCLPLVISLAIATVRLGNFADNSRAVTEDAVALTRGLRSLQIHLLAMERGARQYRVLQDADLLDRIAGHHQEFQTRLENLAQLTLAVPMADDLRRLSAAVTNEYGRFQTRQERDSAIGRLAELGVLVGAYQEQARQLVDRRVAETEREVRALRRWASINIVVSMATAAALTLWFSLLLTRPVTRLIQAIRRLGDGEYSAPVQLGGPSDLVAVGKQLDWLQRRLAELENQQATFLAHVSHELKTPLAALREGAAILADGVAGTLGPEQNRVVEILRHNVARLQAMIVDLVESRRIAGERLALRRENLDLGLLVVEVTTDHALSIRSRNLRLAADLPNTPYYGDRAKLRTAVDNLLSNAVKYSPPGGVLRVRILDRQTDVAIDIIDQGPGIDPAERGRVFEPFYRVPGVAQGPVQGTGLGLSIARSYVVAHEGAIEICDTPEGAHLRILLPLPDRVRQP